MEALYLLIPISVVGVIFAAWLFLRMSQSGQFDDLESPGWSVLHDDDAPAREGEPNAREDRCTTAREIESPVDVAQSSEIGARK